MTVTLTDARTVPAQAWRNGAGLTRELLAWPRGADWRVRVSRADIDADGPFSAFAHTTRWFTVLQGAGVALDFAHATHTLRPGDQPLCFDGAPAPGCRLLDGPTQDLNLMARGGRSTMCRAVAGSAWDAPFAMRGLYATVAGTWRSQKDSRAVAPHNLLWDDQAAPGAWTFSPDDANAAGAAWWLGFTP